MVKPSIRSAAFFSVVTLILSFLSGVSSSSAQDLTIGYVGDFSGIGSFFGSQSQRGAALAAKDLSRGKRTVNVVFEDVAGKIPSAVIAAQKLITQDKAEIIICDLTPVCTALSQTVKDAGKLLIYHSPSTSIASANPYAFRNFMDYTAACEKLTSYWKKSGIAQAGGLNASLEFGERCFLGMEKTYPGHFDYRYNPGDDLRSSVLAFKSHSVDHIVFTGYENDFLSWLKFSREQRQKIIPGFIELLLTDTTWREIGNQDFEAVVAGFKEPPADFRLRLKKEFGVGDDINIHAAALSYNAIRVAAEAAAECPNRNVESLAESFRKPRDGWYLDFKGWGNGAEAYPIIVKTVSGHTIRAVE